jgi:hypothetical protein
MISRTRRALSALHAYGETELTTKRKHAILVAVVGVIAATGVAAMFQNLSEANERDIRRDALITEWRSSLRDYDDAIDRYDLCLIAVQSRIDTRDDNARENASDSNFLDILDNWLDEGADPALAEAREAEAVDAELDEKARPLLDANDCEHPGEMPVFPELP